MNEFDQWLPWIAFAAFFGVVWAILNRLNRQRPDGSHRLVDLTDLHPAARDRARLKRTALENVIENAVPKLSRPLAPKSRLEQRKLKLRLANAGFNAPWAVEVYLAIRLAAMVSGALLAGGTGLLVSGFASKTLLALSVGSAGGLFLPDLVVAYLRKTRQERIFKTLPDALDLLVVCVEVGLGLDAALREIVSELGEGAKDLCNEFNLFNFQIQMGRSRREALHELGLRAGVDDLNALTTVLMQAERFGTGIAQALRELSDGMRVKRRQLAEEKAQKTAVKLIFPLVLFIFPGIFVVLVGPAAIAMMNDLLSQ